jgi:hypothetical protein
VVLLGVVDDTWEDDLVSSSGRENLRKVSTLGLLDGIDLARDDREYPVELVRSLRYSLEAVLSVNMNSFLRVANPGADTEDAVVVFQRYASGHNTSNRLVIDKGLRELDLAKDGMLTIKPEIKVALSEFNSSKDLLEIDRGWAERHSTDSMPAD